MLDFLERVKNIAVKNKALTFVVCLFLALFIAGSVSRCTAVNLTDPEIDEETGEVIEELAPRDPRTDAYDEELNILLEALSIQTFANADGTAVMNIENDTIHEFSDKEDLTSSFVVLTYQPEEQSTVANSEAAPTVENGYILVLEVSDEIYIAKLSYSTQQGANSGNWVLQSDAFDLADTYFSVPALSEFAVDGIGTQADALIGAAKAAEINALIRERCIELYPTATSAAWDDQASVDWQENTVSFSYIVDNANASVLTVVCDLDTGELMIGEGE